MKKMLTITLCIALLCNVFITPLGAWASQATSKSKLSRKTTNLSGTKTTVAAAPTSGLETSSKKKKKFFGSKAAKVPVSSQPTTTVSGNTDTTVPTDKASETSTEFFWQSENSDFGSAPAVTEPPRESIKPEKSEIITSAEALVSSVPESNKSSEESKTSGESNNTSNEPSTVSQAAEAPEDAGVTPSAPPSTGEVVTPAPPAPDAPETARPAGPAETAPSGGVRPENLRITAIEVRGNTMVPTNEIMTAIRSKVGDPLLEPRIESDYQAIYELGYFTDVKIDKMYYAGGVRLVFRVQENPKVSRITIMGNKIVSTDKIRSLMQTQEGRILNLKTLSADMNEINYYYNETLGYILEPTHIKNVTWTPEGEIILTIQDGMIIEDIQITGNTLFPTEQLKGMITMKPGDLLNSKQTKEDATTLSKHYEDQGYILDTIRPQVNYQNGVVTYQIIEYVVEDIRVEFDREDHKTKVETVLRNVRTKPGEVLETKKLQRDIERLNNLGFFSRVNVVPEPGSRPGNVILVIKLQEQKTGLATIGVGYTGGGSGALRSGITGAISFSEKNLGGTGQAVTAAWQRGVNIDVLSTSYANPAINRNQDSLSVSVFRHHYSELMQPITGAQPNTTEFALYDDIRTGGMISYGRRITDDFRAFLSLRHENLEIRQNPKSEYVPIGVSRGKLNALGLGAFYDNRNDVFDPTSGMYVDANMSFAGRFFGGTYAFNKYTAELRKYFPIGRKRQSTIALRAWGGLIRGDAPITETFYVGGTDTIRGYPENAFFGSRMIVLNAEYRFPLGNIKYLKGAIFADAGNAWFPGQRSKLYTDAGAGLRIVFPTLGLGVIRVDYAFSENRNRFSIGIGQTF